MGWATLTSFPVMTMCPRRERKGTEGFELYQVRVETEERHSPEARDCILFISRAAAAPPTKASKLSQDVETSGITVKKPNCFFFLCYPCVFSGMLTPLRRTRDWLWESEQIRNHIASKRSATLYLIGSVEPMTLHNFL